MSDEASRWKEKYLKNIEQQDKLQKRWDAQLDLLRRGLVRSSLAAEGTDRAVDQCMKEMREIVRKDDMDAGLAALIPRLEKAVLDSEQRRETRVGQMGIALNALVSQLQRLPLPREVSRPLKAFAKQLDGRVSQARELPLLLDELSGLQGKALSILENPDEAARPGILQRLFGAREAASVGEEQPSAGLIAAPGAVGVPAQEAVEIPEIASHPIETAPVVAAVAPVVSPTAVVTPAPTAEAVAPVVVLTTVETKQIRSETLDAHPAPAVEVPLVNAEVIEAPIADAEPQAQPQLQQEASATILPSTAPLEEAALEHEAIEPVAGDLDVSDQAEAAYDLPSSPEPTYSSVASHIEETLLGLLDDLTLPEHHRPQAMAMRTRLEKGLNWYELLPILDDLAVLMLAINDSGQHDFELYLKQLNERLEAFQSNLQTAADDHADGRSVARGMQSELREQVGGLQNSVQEAADLSSLKQVLENRLEGLLGTMDQHQRQHDQREQDIASRLQGLATRVATMEQEAQGFRVHLEEQRQKALIDPLTTLPNRAAWTERLQHEVGLWQKNGNRLLLSMIDLDHFKRINDNYGHLAGDKVLKIIASELRKRLRPNDFIARFGGEEFVLLIPNTSETQGIALLDKLRVAVEACPFHFKGEPVTITLSMGITAFRVGERSESVIQRADQALYRAKSEGRNRIEQG
jgi:diguanylate cyclase